MRKLKVLMLGFAAVSLLLVAAPAQAAKSNIEKELEEGGVSPRGGPFARSRWPGRRRRPARRDRPGRWA